jgi:hypothetical protein
MPKFVGAKERKTIAAPWWAKREDGTVLEWVEIRRFGYGQRQRLVDAAVKAGLVAKPDGSGDEISVGELALGSMNLEILRLGVTRWTDDEGVIIPVTADGIAMLTEQDAEFILQEINAFNPQERRSAPAQESFRNGD